MISTAYNFVFIHIPKTGGNAIQSALLPFSDDRKVLGRWHDGVHRFELSGPYTLNKHATLHAELLGLGLNRFKIITVLRDPLDRALPMYFSPSRLLRTGQDGHRFSLSEFSKVIGTMTTVTTFLSIDGTTVIPRFPLRFDSLQPDFDSALRELGLPKLSLESLNVSGDATGMRTALRKDPDVVRLVRAHFAADYDYLSSLAAR